MTESFLREVARQFGTVPTIEKFYIPASPFLELGRSLQEHQGYRTNVADSIIRGTSLFPVNNVAIQALPVIKYDAYIFAAAAYSDKEGNPAPMVGVIPVLDKHDAPVSFELSGENFNGSLITVFASGVTAVYCEKELSDRKRSIAVPIWELPPALFVTSHDAAEVAKSIEQACSQGSLDTNKVPATIDATIRAINGYYFWKSDQLRV